jgi:tRNA A-37 threonylcarbamoyl transferase component Bud32
MDVRAGLDILGVEATASAAEIERAYRRLASSLEKRLAKSEDAATRATLEAELALLERARGVARRAFEVALRPEEAIGSRFTIRRPIGAGGMGEVYEAFDAVQKRECALKFMRPSLLRQPDAVERFLAEAQVSRRLSHPCIVRTDGALRWGDHHFLVMELLRGRTLRDRMRERAEEGRPFSLAEVRKVARAVGDALSYAHRFTVHRDVKPENVWIGEDGRVQLMDFGLARALTASQLTMTGTQMGTAYYMASSGASRTWTGGATSSRRRSCPTRW